MKMIIRLLLFAVFCAVSAIKSVPVHQSLFKTGTTIVGVCCSDGVVLAADTRSTGGNVVINQNTKKIHQISGSIFCCGAGTAGDCDQIKLRAAHDVSTSRASRMCAGDYSLFDSLTGVVKSMTDSIHNYKKFTYRKPEAVFILGGVDSDGPALFRIDAKGVAQKSAYTTLGSGSFNAMAVLESELHKLQIDAKKQRDQDTLRACEYQLDYLSVEEAVLIVKKAVLSGIANDLGSGSHVDLCMIRRDGAVKSWREHQHIQKPRDVSNEPHSPEAVLSLSGQESSQSSSGGLGRLIQKRRRSTPAAAEVHSGNLFEKYGIRLRAVEQIEDELSCGVEIIE